ncbi:hypothetical protein RFI_31253 [Reticulomyxa filosa]|uniref:Uncharacterized protein n=1 Tax=Reticulomyxa filosa TaxID=46433 RepID=X6LW13_RETFI|nr:hypothetical protein RFI_31253 [Reticulomyxa filosa]|eukprot:ETO06143.1 hypothetical protein RFI_31253 [Reticulomyxa filosa]
MYYHQSSSRSNSESSKWLCWSSPYQAIGIVRYEIEFSEHYHKTSAQSHMCQQVWMPLTPSPNNYTLRVHTICEFNQETHRSLPSPVLSVPAEFVILEHSKSLHYVFLLVNRLSHQEGYLLQLDIKGFLFYFFYFKKNLTFDKFFCLNKIKKGEKEIELPFEQLSEMDSDVLYSNERERIGPTETITVSDKMINYSLNWMALSNSYNNYSYGTRKANIFGIVYRYRLTWRQAFWKLLDELFQIT